MRSVLSLLGLAALTACGDAATSGTSGNSGNNGSVSGGATGTGEASPKFEFSDDEKTGIATFYDADGSGNCSYERSPGALDVVALNFPEYAGSAACGACIHVVGPKGAVDVRVVDSCPGCKEHHLDLSAEAFAKVAEPRDGRVAIKYSTVACSISGQLSYRFKEGSSKYWTAIQVRNHPIPIAKLEYKRAGSYVEMKRESYNYFVESRGVGDQPSGLSLRITSVDGRAVEDTLSGGVQDGRIVVGAAQFK